MTLRRWLADHFRVSPRQVEHEALEELVRFVIARKLRLPHYDELQRVIDVNQTRRRGAELLTLEDLELYADGFVLCFRLAGGWQRWWLDIRGREFHVAPPEIGYISVSDDIGTEYRAVLRRRTRSESEFGGLPGIPAIAKRLNVTVRRQETEDVSFEISLEP